MFGQAGVRGGQSIAALPREERASQQSSINFHVLTLASKYFNSHLTCMALTWLFQSRRPIPSDAPGGVFSTSGENDGVVGGGVCSFAQVLSETRVDSRSGV
eukprot:scaffold6107_cov130-Isochrysis_galbana.AAC.1